MLDRRVRRVVTEGDILVIGLVGRLEGRSGWVDGLDVRVIDGRKVCSDRRSRTRQLNE